ncbi:MAG: FtsK/SpoIIIE domain-containing protein [Pirellulaceae bacterium]|nr:FtsK/SpoIIIE domain-containing protein [Pirellulaceae bacterium]
MTSSNLTTQRQRELIASVRGLVATRSKDEVAIRERHARRLAEGQQRHDRERAAAIADFEAKHARLAGEYQRLRGETYWKYESAGEVVATEEHALAESASAAYSEQLENAKTLLQHKQQRTLEDFSAEEVLPKQELTKFQQVCEWRATELEALVVEAKKIATRRTPWPDLPLPPPLVPPKLKKRQYLERVAVSFNYAKSTIAQLQHLPAPRFVEDGWPVLIFIFAAVALAYPSYLLLRTYGAAWWIGGFLMGALAVALIVWQLVRPFARKQTLALLPGFLQAIAQAKADLEAARKAATREADRRQRKLVKRRDRDQAAAQAEFDHSREELSLALQSKLGQADVQFMARRQAIAATHEQQLDTIEANFPPQIAQLEQEFERRLLALAEEHRARRVASQQEFEREWSELVTRWSAGLAEFQTAVREMNEFQAANFPAWERVDPKTWQPPKSTIRLPALAIGSHEFSAGALREGKSLAAGLEFPNESFHLPTLLTYPDRPSLVLAADGEGRDAATRTLQNVMLRLLTSFPPGKVRFTIIDPVGLGQNFSAFMHLADFDERLVTNRIWTESAHIQQRLTDLTEHMEKVIQKYLRNEFASIQEYNEHAGEVAEPFQILVVANFPANFSDEAARRLVSIASSGARCGVYTLISTDTKLKLPRNFDLADIQTQAETLAWDEAARRFAWKYDDLSGLPLTLEAPPGDDKFTDLVKIVGRLAKDAARVEVPFEAVVPPPETWWTLDSRGEIEVPLGRAGATKLQALRLGKGTSQHVLISGKTGSGKSTLLNALITNLALHYSPDELQFYLIDFKKGVEFKAYAACKLPHARVIAIESEREFGMSVLERLDQELKRRGDLFRKEGVQDLKGYRNSQPTAVMPRILLIIDEFQEFFTTDDKISHDASLLLDRLVRQGRAFGIHVLLGSQTLAGAYSLARSTIGQMAVRIALQCSESDAHLILSEDNTAARLLSRPGEAIYNDANGLLEGNHPFQVVWLSDELRESYLEKVADMARERQLSLPTPIVFEGNAAADLATNDLLAVALASPTRSVSVGVLTRSASEGTSPFPTVLHAWLGAAVAIKDPTSAVFRRQGGSNLLVVGQQDEAALGIFASALVSLGAQLPRPAGQHAGDGAAGNGATNNATPGLQSFYLLDGARPDAPEAGYLRKLTTQIGLDAKVVTPRDAAQVVRKLAEEVERRLAAGEANDPPIFLLIYNLARFRDLKKSEDFASFGDDDAGPSAEKQLTTILREGPALGVHTIVWCDSYSNVNRWLERQTLRDLEMRVLFQMSATDSSNLMDSPAASRLGVHLAMFYSEEQGQIEKFRPYGVPSAEWLMSVAERFAGRAGQPVAEEQQTGTRFGPG